MNMCPKCGTLLNGNEEKCPRCNTMLVNKNIEILDTNESNKKENSINKKEKITKILKIASIIILILIIILLVLNIIFKLKYSKNNEYLEEKQEEVVEEQPKFDTPLTVISDFLSDDETFFSFQSDGTFYWYDSELDEDNYYQGKFTYMQGEDALTDMGVNKDDFLNIFGEDVDVKNVYSINIDLEKRVTDKIEGENKGQWWYLLVIKDNENAIGYNKNLDARYILQRK